MWKKHGVEELEPGGGSEGGVPEGGGERRVMLQVCE